mmetsp:Transcript_2777/g.4680  ORF Transcript_2777/g.4680 Transcript_2777/m.4680 type:complete len:378 (+) Transcript_2777:292-1425(+)
MFGTRAARRSLWLAKQGAGLDEEEAVAECKEEDVMLEGIKSTMGACSGPQESGQEESESDSDRSDDNEDHEDEEVKRSRFHGARAAKSGKAIRDKKVTKASKSRKARKATKTFPQAEDKHEDLDEESEYQFDGVELVPGLLFGSESCALDPHGREKHGVTHVITALSRLETSFEPDSKMLLRGKWCFYDRENRPTADLLSILDDAVEFIDAALGNGGKVCVISLEGQSRSAAICLAYLIKSKRTPLKEAKMLVEARYPEVAINRGFWRQLSCFEKAALGETSIPENELPGAIIFEKEELQALMDQYTEKRRRVSARKTTRAFSLGADPKSPTSATGIGFMSLGSPDHKRKGEYSWPNGLSDKLSRQKYKSPRSGSFT